MDKSILQYLNDSSESQLRDEIRALSATVDTVLMNLHSLINNQKITDPQMGEIFGQLAVSHSNRRQEITSSGKQVFETMAGRGPRANRLRNIGAVTAKLTNDPDAQSRLNAWLAEFDLQPTRDEALVESLNSFLRDLRPYVHGDVAHVKPFKLLQEHHGFDAMQSGIYVDTRPKHVRHAIVVLTGRVSTAKPNLKYLLIATADQPAAVYFKHELEDVWMPSQGVTFPGLVQALRRRLSRVLSVFRISEADTDWQAEFRAIEAKAHLVFDDEQYLPAQYLRFNRENDTVSNIEFPALKYHLVFRNTKGEYPMRTTSVLELINLTPSAVNVFALPDSIKRQILNIANDHLNNLLAEVDHFKVQAGAAPKDEPLPVTAI